MPAKDKSDVSVNSKQFVSRGQNPSGHITMDSQQVRFYQEIMAKDHRMMKLAELGMLEYKRARNPLAAERSPRGEFIGYDFSIPPKEPEKERWQYPDSDWGIMSKFATQKPIYDVILQREKDMPQLLLERERIRIANQARVQKVIREQKAIIERSNEESLAEEKRMLELEAMMENPQKYHDEHKDKIRAAKRLALQAQAQLNKNLLDDEEDPAERQKRLAQEAQKNHRSLPLDHFLDPNHDKTDHSSLAAVARSTKQNLRKIKQEFRHKSSLPEFKVTTIKGLEHTAPQVLAEYRADRAAQFIQKQGERALYPPPVLPADVPFFQTAPAFRGGGILLASTKELEVQARKNAEAKALLRQGLKSSSTLQALQRQEQVKQQQQQQQQQSQNSSSMKSTNNNHSSSASHLDLTMLQEQLRATEDNIERQKLKMALKTKPPKSFQAATQAHLQGTNNSSSGSDGYRSERASTARK